MSTPVGALFRPHRHHRLDSCRTTRRRETGEKRDTDGDRNAQSVNQRFHGGACQSPPGDISRRRVATMNPMTPQIPRAASVNTIPPLPPTIAEGTRMSSMLRSLRSSPVKKRLEFHAEPVANRIIGADESIGDRAGNDGDRLGTRRIIGGAAAPAQQWDVERLQISLGHLGDSHMYIAPVHV